MDRRTNGALALALALAGCGGGTPKIAVDGARDDAANVTISAGGSTVTVRGGGPADTLAVAAAPDPAELAAIERYPGAAVKNDTSVVADGKAGRSGILSFETPDRPAEVIAFYRAAAARAGYHIEGEIDVAGMVLLSGKRPDGSAFQLSVSRTGETSAATLITGAKG